MSNRSESKQKFQNLEKTPQKFKMSDTITENHQIYTFEHEMNVEGNHLVEKKQKTITEPKDSENSGGTTILVHIRSIGERIVKIIEKTNARSKVRRKL